MEHFRGGPIRRVADLPAMSGTRYPDHTALRYDERTRTYADLETRANKVANVLQEAGVGPGDRVGLYLSNTLTFPEAYFGVLRHGAVAVPLNIRRPVEGLCFVADDADLTALVGEAQHESEVVELADSVGIETVLLAGGAPSTAIDYDAAVADASAETPQPERGYRDEAVMLYTSGTTGKPKGVPLTNENVLTAIDAMSKSGYYVPVDPDSSILVATPLFHAAGLNAILGVYLYRGGTVVILDSTDPETMLDVVARHEIQNLGGVPTLYTKMNERYQQSPAEYDLSSLEVVAASGANLSDATRRALHEDWEVVITEGWGMTETGPCGTFQPHRGARKAAGCVGPPMHGVSVKIVDPETRAEVVPAALLEPHVDIAESHLDFDSPAATTGEIAIRGPQVFEGYHRRPELTAEAFDDEGWFYTKDIARVDEDGYLWIVDRADDMLRCGGENVYPAEVESALHEHPAVVEAAVVGHRHETKGEAPVAFVVAREDATVDERAVRKFALERLPAYAHPRRVFVVDTLPKSATAKIQRYKLRENAGERIDGALAPSERL